MTNLTEEGKSLYSDAFYLKQRDRSYDSAGCVLPLVLSMVAVESAVDVGCGVGTWAAKLLELGVREVVGIDGDYVNRELLKIPPQCFLTYDLSKPLAVSSRYDLALCMEVAEHLPPSRAASLVEDLIALAPVVLFSAAIPGQGGVNHINEQYLSYWAALFHARGYTLLDVVRPILWNDERCDWVYKQNAVLFVESGNPLASRAVPSGIDYVHPYLLDSKREQLDRPLLGFLFKSFPGSLARSLRKRAGRLVGR